MLNSIDVLNAQKRLTPYLAKTPLLEFPSWNERFGCRVFLKYEGDQHTGSFKLRGALNTVLLWRENGEKIRHIVAVSSGNHAQAVAYAAKLFQYPCTIFMPKNGSKYKIQRTQELGAKVELCSSRQEMVDRALDLERQGSHYIPPFDLDSVIAGQGTACLEVLQSGLRPKAIFATVSGGGWIGGTYLATQQMGVPAATIGVEPTLANDGYLSFLKGEIVALDKPSETIADGARVPQMAIRTFELLKNFDAMISVEESEIIQWSADFSNVSGGLIAEPTSAVAIAGAWQWMNFVRTRCSDKIALNPRQKIRSGLLEMTPQDSILVMISGQNVDRSL